MWSVSGQDRTTVKTWTDNWVNAMADYQRNRPKWSGTLAADVVAYLEQPEINASRLVEAAIRDKVREEAIEEAARDAGMSKEDIVEARRS
jgi:hypothetical protein